MAAVSYVKFMRGSQAKYNSLMTKDQDTLYFVYDNIQDDHGKLYLGNRLISGSSENPSGTISISQISDVALGSGATDGQVLVYNEATKKWEPKSIEEASGIAVMKGATAEVNGVSGLVPVPKAGDQGKFLRGDGTWVEVSDIGADVSNLKAQVITLVGDDKDKSVREIANEELVKQLIPDNAQESLDSLQEIANWIQQHPKDASDMNSKISDNAGNITILQGDVKNLQTLLNGDSTADPATEGLVSRVSKLELTMGTFTPVEGSYLNVGEATTYFNNSITEINDRLRWHELDEA